jgi:thiol-disulfide isomerase/thioredoxin
MTVMEKQCMLRFPTLLILVLAGLVLSTGCNDAAAGPQSTSPADPTAPGEATAPSVDVRVTPVVPLPLPDSGPAPDFRNDIWINSEPLRLADLEGKVVLVEFWTFGCINCQRVIPHVNAWYETYASTGFEVVGIHYPEFEYERDIDNVRAAVTRLEIDYPVAIDNDRLTWGAYNQRYWPTLYLLDKAGHIRYKHIGEGAYAETEAAIRQLLTEPAP